VSGCPETGLQTPPGHENFAILGSESTSAKFSGPFFRTLLVVYCRSRYRSSIATSLLRRAGFRDIANLMGGFDAWKTAGLPYALPALASV
jgi:rhodanese-related sulfurtransferase